MRRYRRRNEDTLYLAHRRSHAPPCWRTGEDCVCELASLGAVERQSESEPHSHGFLADVSFINLAPHGRIIGQIVEPFRRRPEQIIWPNDAVVSGVYRHNLTATPRRFHTSVIRLPHHSQCTTSPDTDSLIIWH